MAAGLQPASAPSVGTLTTTRQPPQAAGAATLSRAAAQAPPLASVLRLTPPTSAPTTTTATPTRPTASAQPPSTLEQAATVRLEHRVTALVVLALPSLGLLVRRSASSQMAQASTEVWSLAPMPSRVAQAQTARPLSS